MKYALIIAFFISLQTQAQMPKGDTDRYTKVNTGYLMVLRQGDTVFSQLERIAIKEKIPSANFSGMGFLGHVRFGFFNTTTKEYEPRDFYNLELASLTGTIAWEQGKPSLHMHGVGGDKEMKTYSGHILSAVVGTGSLEILITVHQERLERKMDPVIGAKVLQVAKN